MSSMPISLQDRSANQRTSFPPRQPRSQEKAMPLPPNDKHTSAMPTTMPPSSLPGMHKEQPTHLDPPHNDREGFHASPDHSTALTTTRPTSMFPGTMQNPGYKGPSQMHNPRGGSLMFLTSDDHVLSKHIEDTHFPDESHYFEVRPLFQVVEDILNHAIEAVEGTVSGSEPRRKVIDPKRGLGLTLDKYYMKCIIERVYCEMSPFTVKHWGGADGHETTLSVLKLLSLFTWEVKAAITLAAFALNYGELWLIAEVYSMNPLAKSMAVLKQVPDVVEQTSFHRKQFDAINSITKAMLRMCNCILEFKELPLDYVNKEEQGYKDCEILVPIAVFWIIRAAVAATAQITAMVGTEGSVTGELSNWEFNLSRTYEKFKLALQRLRDGILQRLDEDKYRQLVEIFKTRIELKLTCEDPIYDGANKTAASLDVLNGKNVLLLISDGLNIPNDELSILEQIYTDSKGHSYEVLWIPIIDRKVQWTDPMQDQFERIKLSMPWYTVSHPSKISKYYMRYVREYWRFKGEPILVVLDPRRRVVCPNAIHMMWIWGSNAFPFTKEMEINLWRNETWRLELLIDGIDQTVLDWVHQGKFILVYGTSDYEWVRKLTKEARSYAQAAEISLEIVYVGKLDMDSDLHLKHTSAIRTDKLGHCWEDSSAVWFFWKRIESMFKSKIMLNHYNDRNDTIAHELKKLRTYIKSPSGWALLSRGREILFQAPISILYEALETGPRKFPEQFIKHCHEKKKDCAEINFSSTAFTPSKMHCPECHRAMEKQTTFRCCHKDGPWTEPIEEEVHTRPFGSHEQEKEPKLLTDVPGASFRNEPLAPRSHGPLRLR